MFRAASILLVGREGGFCWNQHCSQTLLHKKHLDSARLFCSRTMSTIPARPFSFFEMDVVDASPTTTHESDAKRLKRTPAMPMDLSSINKDFTKLDEMRSRSTDLALQLKLETMNARRKLFSGTYTPQEDEMTFQPILLQIRQHYSSEQGITTTVASTNVIGASDSSSSNTGSIMEGKDFQLSNRLEDYARFKALAHFLSTGTLIAPGQLSSISILSDEEYLTGVVMGLTEELSRYVLGRAIVRDMTSVTLAKNMVEKILDYLLTFDFRNGYLRRKYDGVKYALKTCETVLYELSVTSGTIHVQEETTGKLPIGETPKDPGADVNVSTMPMEPLVDLRKRIEHKDNVRESLIKQCRDAQKAAKQAIYASHRGDYSRASKHISECEAMIQNILLPMIAEDPSLRCGGSLGSVFEEYIEAKLFYIWLHGGSLTDKEVATLNVSGHEVKSVMKPSCGGTILLPQEFPFPVRSEEYLGALCDLTGEIGRYAVQRGTARDTVGVSLCLETSTNILNAIESLHRYPYGFGKKMDQLKRNVEKLERMLYELSLVQATGRNFEPKDFSLAEPEDEKFRRHGNGEYHND